VFVKLRSPKYIEVYSPYVSRLSSDSWMAFMGSPFSLMNYNPSKANDRSVEPVEA
jgi:hypothetical protein